MRPLLTTFNRRWHPPSQRNVFLTAFSQTNWDHLPSDEKNKHTLRQCSACHTYHLSLTLSFPDKRDQSLLKNELPAISFNERDLSSASNFGKKALKELNSICENQFNKSAQTVITETPQSKLIAKPSSADRLSEKRKLVKETKKIIQQSMDDSTMNTVMSNRLSWRKFDTIRKTQTLDNSSALNQGLQENGRAFKQMKARHQSESMVHCLFCQKLCKRISSLKLALGVIMKQSTGVV